MSGSKGCLYLALLIVIRPPIPGNPNLCARRQCWGLNICLPHARLIFNLKRRLRLRCGVESFVKCSVLLLTLLFSRNLPFSPFITLAALLHIKHTNCTIRIVLFFSSPDFSALKMAKRQKDKMHHPHCSVFQLPRFFLMCAINKTESLINEEQ